MRIKIVEKAAATGDEARLSRSNAVRQRMEGADWVDQLGDRKDGYLHTGWSQALQLGYGGARPGQQEPP